MGHDKGASHDLRTEPPAAEGPRSEEDMRRDMASAQLDRLLTPLETATALGLSLSWLAKSRIRGDGPLYIKIGRSVRYRESAIRDYLKLRTRSSTYES